MFDSIVFALALGRSPAQVFLAVQAERRNLTFDSSAEARLEHWISEQARIRKVRKVLVDLNVSAPDGRQLPLKLRQGDQHELSYVVCLPRYRLCSALGTTLHRVRHTLTSKASVVAT